MKKKPEELTFPFIVSKGSVSVKIYRTPSHGCESFTLSYYQDGARKRPAFPSFGAAQYYVRKHQGHVAHKLVKDVVAELLAAKKADKCSERYLECLKYNLGKFAKRFTGNIGAATGGDVAGKALRKLAQVELETLQI